MPRTYRLRLPADTSLFTPLQLQAKTICAWGMSGYCGWLAEHLFPMSRIISEHQTGWVVAGLDAHYLAPFSFWDASHIDCVTTAKFMKGGAFASTRMECLANGTLVATGSSTCRTIQLGGDASLAATPGQLAPTLVARLGTDELSPDLPDRPLLSLLAQFEKQAPLAAATLSIAIHRHQVEVADQWSFIEISNFASEGRERLIQREGGRFPALKRGLSQPLQRLLAEFRQPMFLFDEAVLQTSAFEGPDGLAFVHRISGPAGPHAVAVEQF